MSHYHTCIDYPYDVGTCGACYDDHLKRRMEALDDAVFFEVSTPDLDDVVRLDDDYGREGTNAP